MKITYPTKCTGLANQDIIQIFVVSDDEGSILILLEFPYLFTWVQVVETEDVNVECQWPSQNETYITVVVQWFHNVRVTLPIFQNGNQNPMHVYIIAQSSMTNRKILVCYFFYKYLTSVIILLRHGNSRDTFLKCGN